jgi:hypothetical protein
MSKNVRIVFQAEPEQARLYLTVSSVVGMPMSELFRRATIYYIVRVLSRQYGRDIAKSFNAPKRSLKSITVITRRKRRSSGTSHRTVVL